MLKLFVKIITYVIIMLMVISMTGCWDNKDITDRAFVSAVGLDKDEEGNIEVTLQILRPNIIKAKQEGGSEESAIWVFTSTGKTVFDAVRNQLKTVNRKPFYSHLNLIVIGEELAKEGIKDVLDFFLRDHEMKLMPKLLVAKGTKSKNVLSAESEIENVPSMHIESILENNVSEAKTKEIKLIDVYKDLSFQYPSTTIGNVFFVDEKESNRIKDMMVEGASVFKKDKLIGFIDSIETRGYLFIKDEVKSGIINIDSPINKNKDVAIEIKSSKGEMKAEVKDQELILSVQVKTNGTIGEQQGSEDLSLEDMIKKVEKSVEEEITKNIESAIEVAQDKYKLDFLGFSQIVYRNYPNYWKQVKEDWDKEFSKTYINISVEAEIDRTGIITEPINFE